MRTMPHSEHTHLSCPCVRHAIGKDGQRNTAGKQSAKKENRQAAGTPCVIGLRLSEVRIAPARAPA